jgi:methylthioribose-1-phosphate isomerase
MLAAVALLLGLTACSSEDKVRAHEEAEKAKADLKQGARQTAVGLKKAGNAVDHGAKKLKDKVDKELNTSDHAQDTTEH